MYASLLGGFGEFILGSLRLLVIGYFGFSTVVPATKQALVLF